MAAVPRAHTLPGGGSGRAGSADRRCDRGAKRNQSSALGVLHYTRHQFVGALVDQGKGADAAKSARGYTRPPLRRNAGRPGFPDFPQRPGAHPDLRRWGRKLVAHRLHACGAEPDAFGTWHRIGHMLDRLFPSLAGNRRGTKCWICPQIGRRWRQSSLFIPAAPRLPHHGRNPICSGATKRLRLHNGTFHRAVKAAWPAPSLPVMTKLFERRRQALNADKIHKLCVLA